MPELREKKPLLNEIGSRLDLTVSGLENFPVGEPSVIVANHTCMNDIFAVSASLPEATQIVLSARLMWKRTTPETSLRRRVIEEALYGIPLEVHGGQERLEVGFEMAKRALLDGWSVIIFPEGAYTGEHHVTKGRTGASRILYDARQEGLGVNLIPVGINTVVDSNKLDSIDTHGHAVSVSIGTPIAYDEYFDAFVGSSELDVRKAALRTPVDLAMKSIAQATGRPYIDEYIELRPRDTIILETGEEVSLKAAGSAEGY